MKNPEIVFTAPGVTELWDAPMPVAGEQQVVVKLMCSTISAGTERANLVGDPSVSCSKGPSVVFPRRCGYSSAGVVVSVGEGVTSVKVGDRVACFHSYHRQYCLMKESNVYPLEDGVSFSEAALAYIATFPMAAIRKCRLEYGESAIVMGQGILGQLAVKMLHVAGAAPILAVDPIAEKRERALELGADYALDPFAEDFAKEAKRLTEGGAHVAIEVTGKGQGLDMVLDCTRKFGRVALLGCTRNSDFSIDYYRKVHAPGITLVGAHTNARPKTSAPGWWTERDDIAAFLRFLACNRLEVASLVEEVHSPLEAPAVFNRLANSPAFPIVQFDWSVLK